MNFKLLKIFLIPAFIGMSQVASAQALLSNFEVQSQIELSFKYTEFPVKLDKITNITSIQTFGVRGLQYNYTLDLNISDLGDDVAINMTRDTIRNRASDGLCNNPAMVWHKENFVELKYVYSDNVNTSIFEFKVNPNDC